LIVEGCVSTSQLQKSTYVYKDSGVPIELDVYRPAGPHGLRPVVVWIHGGALVMSSRLDILPHMFDLCRDQGYALVSIDYRLAPQVRVPAIVEDIADAFRWIRTTGREVAGLDPVKVAVAGNSAGGYLTLMAGVVVEPKPVALVSYYGYGDVDGRWYTEPSDHYRASWPLYTDAEAVAGLREDVVTSPQDEEDQKGRERYYLHLRQHGLWTRAVTGLNPSVDRAQLDALCPVRNVTPGYPPTLLIHGTLDTDVPYACSVEMAGALAREGVVHQLLTLEGAGHGLTGIDRSLVSAAEETAAAFLVDHLGQGLPTT
jgi:acetyl esterase/lipase